MLVNDCQFGLVYAACVLANNCQCVLPLNFFFCKNNKRIIIISVHTYTCTSVIRMRPFRYSMYVVTKRSMNPYTDDNMVTVVLFMEDVRTPLGL